MDNQPSSQQQQQQQSSQQKAKPKENLQHLKDPNTAPARIYIGNVPENCTKQDLEEKFAKYGQINGILMQRGFAFLQFMAADSATEAIAKENKTQLLDKIIAVRTAVRDAKNNQNQNKGSGSSGNNNNDAPTPQPPSAPILESLKQPSTFIRNADANDVEIIVVAKELTPYAELLEGRLKRVGISCDLLYPNSEVPMGKVLANISSRGTLYAILVTPTNMEHKSITVNILYGTPAEHRNMPVEAALTLIERDFKDYVSKQTATEAAATAQTIGLLAQKPAPEIGATGAIDPVMSLLRILAEGKPLTVLQYDRVLKYITEKREQQLKAEIGDDPHALAKLSKPLSTIEPDPPKILDPAEAALQKKMNDIINKPSLINVYDSKREPFKMTPELLELLADARVERALDSLLSKEIFATLNLKF